MKEMPLKASILLLSICSVLLITGCDIINSGSSSSSSDPSATAYISPTANASSDQSGSSIRNNIRANTAFVATQSYVAHLYINDRFKETNTATYSEGLLVGETFEIDSLEENEELEFKIVFMREDSERNSDGITVIKHETLTRGTNNFTTEANLNTTAKAIVYEKWKSRPEARGSNFREFENLLGDKDLSAILAEFESEFDIVINQDKASFVSVRLAAATIALALDVPEPEDPSEQLQGVYNIEAFDDADRYQRNIYFVIEQSETGDPEIVVSEVYDSYEPVMYLKANEVYTSGNTVSYSFDNEFFTATGTITIDGDSFTGRADVYNKNTNEETREIYTGQREKPSAVLDLIPPHEDIKGIFPGSLTSDSITDYFAFYMRPDTTNSKTFVYNVDPVSQIIFTDLSFEGKNTMIIEGKETVGVDEFDFSGEVQIEYTKKNDKAADVTMEGNVLSEFDGTTHTDKIWIFREHKFFDN